MRVAHHDEWELLFDETSGGKSIFERLFVNRQASFVLIFPNQDDVSIDCFEQSPNICRIICKELIGIFADQDVYSSATQPEDCAISLESVNVSLVIVNCPLLSPLRKESKLPNVISKVFSVERLLYYQYTNQRYRIYIVPEQKRIVVDTRRLGDQIREDMLAIVGQTPKQFDRNGAQKVRFAHPRVFLSGDSLESERIQALWKSFILFQEKESVQEENWRKKGKRFLPGDDSSPVHQLTIDLKTSEIDSLNRIIESKNLPPAVKFSGSAQEVEVVLALICLRYGLVKGET